MLWVLIGNPENRRLQMMQQVLYAQGIAFHTLTYHSLLMASSIENYLTSELEQYSSEKWFVRIESPGENEAVENSLIALGESTNNSASEISKAQALSLESDKGRIRYSRQWYAGFSHLLNKLELNFSEIEKSRLIKIDYLNTPASIQLLFDKPRCQQWLKAHNIASPRLMPDADSYQQLKHSLMNSRCYRVFVKLNFGSSASGVVALQIKPDGSQVRASTSIEYIDKAGQCKLYNSLKIRHYHCEKTIAKIINELIRQGCYSEIWTPKAQLQQHSYDLRIVVIQQQPCHSVLRMSQTPLTNLHLGNRRGDVNKLDSEVYQAACELAKSAVSTINGAGNVGADVLITQGSNQAKIIELNAFGDLLPGILYKQLSTYEYQCEQFSQRAIAI